MGTPLAIPHDRLASSPQRRVLRAEPGTPTEFARHIAERLGLGKAVEDRAAKICDAAASSGAKIDPNQLILGAAAVCVASLVVKAEEIMKGSPTSPKEGILFTDMHALLGQRRVRASIEKAGFEIGSSARFTDILRALYEYADVSPDVAKILTSTNKMGRKSYHIVLPEQKLIQHPVSHRT